MTYWHIDDPSPPAAPLAPVRTPTPRRVICRACGSADRVPRAATLWTCDGCRTLQPVADTAITPGALLCPYVGRADLTAHGWRGPIAVRAAADWRARVDRELAAVKRDITRARNDDAAPAHVQSWRLARLGRRCDRLTRQRAALLEAEAGS